MEQQQNTSQQQNDFQKLTINTYKHQIIKAISQNQVTIITGETGCGKTTQIPKYIIESDENAKVIVMQPKKIITMTIAKRVAEQLQSPLGDLVGYQIGDESKVSDDSRIRFITSSVMLEKLISDDNFPSQITHFIFDEIHQRGINADFCLIAMKLYLAKKKDKKFKIILVSATIHQKLFLKYFKFNNEATQEQYENINEALGTIFILQSKKLSKKNQKKKQQALLAKKKKEQQIQFFPNLISIKNNRNFPIIIKYIQDFLTEKQKMELSKGKKYKKQYEVGIQINSFYQAVGLRLIDQYISNGNILVFLPGMRQIKSFSNKLKQMKKDYNIIQLHSKIQGGYARLHAQDPRPTIILSTNVIESSITLQKLIYVIDYCRTNLMYTENRYRTLELSWASRSSLQQRAGRVGRLHYGYVFRMITKKQYQNLHGFDIPQIQRSSLQMTILKIKKLEYINNRNNYRRSNLFSNPYKVFKNAIEPPKIQEITQSITRLIQANALFVRNVIERSRPKMYNGSQLIITKLGNYMQKMPCDINFSKMLLLAAHLGCFQQILNICAINLNKRSFFVPLQKIQSLEDYIHLLISYDSSYFNDFKIKQQLFYEWMIKFFYPKMQLMTNTFQNENQSDDSDSDQENQNILKIKKFCRSNAGNEESRWCKNNFVSPRNLRDILLIRETLRKKFLYINKNINIIVVDKKDRELAIDIVLFSGFNKYMNNIVKKKPTIPREDDPHFQQIKSLKLDRNKTILLKDFPQNQKVNIEQFLNNNKFKIQNSTKSQNTIFLQSNYKNLTELCFPAQIMLKLNDYKINQFKQSDFFKTLAKSCNQSCSEFQLEDFITSEKIHIDHESINSSLFSRSGYIIGNGYFKLKKGKCKIQSTFYLNKIDAILLMLIFFKDVQLVRHKSGFFYQQIKIDSKISLQLPIFLDKQIMVEIIQIRQILSDIYKLQENNSINTDLIRKFVKLFDRQFQIIQTNNINRNIQRNQIKIQKLDAQQLDMLISTDQYKEWRKKWKINVLKKIQSYKQINFRQSCGLICALCYPLYTQVNENIRIQNIIRKKGCFATLQSIEIRRIQKQKQQQRNKETKQKKENKDKAKKQKEKNKQTQKKNDKENQKKKEQKTKKQKKQQNNNQNKEERENNTKPKNKKQQKKNQNQKQDQKQNQNQNQNKKQNQNQKQQGENRNVPQSKKKQQQKHESNNSQKNNNQNTQKKQQETSDNNKKSQQYQLNHSTFDSNFFQGTNTISPQDQIYCPNFHLIGYRTNQLIKIYSEQNLLIIFPQLHTSKFSFRYIDIPDLKQREIRQQQKIMKQRKDFFQCQLCGFSIQSDQNKKEFKQKMYLWQIFDRHMNSQSHKQNYLKLKNQF